MDRLAVWRRSWVGACFCLAVGGMAVLAVQATGSGRHRGEHPAWVLASANPRVALAPVEANGPLVLTADYASAAAGSLRVVVDQAGR